MPKDDLLYAGHMLDCARDAISLLGGRTRCEFDADKALRLALTHLLQTIGEAARRVSSEYRSQHASIPWDAIIGMRHRVVHDYMNVDEDIVWEVVTKELGSLIQQLEALSGI
ncbi:MAG: DUF86 domain-containing protein [Bryobacteraceae bacterium]